MNFDAIVIGAGPSGSSVATALAAQGRSVAIVERSVFPRRKVCGEFISAGSFAVLQRLGVGDEVSRQAGPEVQRLALFAAGPGIEAPMPRAEGRWPYGRAIGRDVLDALLLDRARLAGATVFQPFRATGITHSGDKSQVEVEGEGGKMTLVAPVIIAAHGSWEAGSLPTQASRPHRPSDLLAFKARYKGATLRRGLMPLLAFPGGYGGMVWSDRECLSVSCCIRRDQLAAIRAGSAGVAAGEAVINHILASCPAAAVALAGAELVEDWQGAGPIRPGISLGQEEVFRVGNLAGESHPIIAEGISMALQSGWLLATELARHGVWDRPATQIAQQRYAEAWKRHFALRIAAAEALYQLSARPFTARLMQVVVGLLPAALPIGAHLAGKSAPPPQRG